MSNYIERHDCTAEIITELPGSGDLRQFCFPTSASLGRYELMVKFSPANEESWIGIFDSYGYGQTGLYTLPHAPDLLVVAKGSGYTIDVQSPLKTKPYEPVFPMLGCILLRQESLVVLHDFSDMQAFDKNGEKWFILSLASDDLKVLEYTDEVLKGESSINGRAAWFTVDVESGRYQSGEVD